MDIFWISVIVVSSTLFGAVIGAMCALSAAREHYGSILMTIADCETPCANATVRRMASIARLYAKEG